VSFLRNSDPYAPAYFPRRPDGVAKPQGAGGAQVHAVKLRANTHGLGESSRASGKVDQGRARAAKAHQMDSIERLKGAQQDASPHPANFARDVHQEVQTIRLINIRVPTIEKQRLVSQCKSSIGMPGGVAHDVSFGFYDPPAHSSGPSLMHQRLADKVFREFDGVSG
jgi:hypothetical protein